MRHQSILLVLVLSGGCAEGLGSDGTGAGGSTTGEWTGSPASSSAASGSSSASASTSGSATTSASTASAASSSSTSGSGSGGGDPTPPTVMSVIPGEGATAVSSIAKISVTFSELMDPATITSTTSTSCSGSVQVSNDDFTTCAPMNGAPSTNDDVTFTFVPAGSYSSLGQYRVRVTAAATDASGNALSPAFQSTTGFQIGFWHSVTIDGANDFAAATDAFATSTAGTQLYVTHDDDDLFVGLSSPDIAPQSAGNKFVYFLFSTDSALMTGNALSSDGKAKFGTGKAMTWHYKERIAGGTYSEFRVGDASGWSTDWSNLNKESNVGTGFLEARIGLSEFGGASTLAVTAYTVDYDGDGGSGWLYNMFAGAADGSGAQPRDVVRYVDLTLPAALVPNDASHLAVF